MPSDAIELRSKLSTNDIARIFQSTLNGRKVEFDSISDATNPFANLEVRPDFSVVASHEKSIGSWAVQLYIYDENTSRRVELHPVYHSMLNRAWSGTKNTYSKSAGVKNAQSVVAELRRADPSLIDA
jgi:hypothetical protein